MIVFPAIDLKNGECVRLHKGDFNTVHQVAADPFETAADFHKKGAQWLHTVDLDGAKNGKAENRTIIKELAKSTGLFVQTGGGIRCMKDCEELLSSGISRLVLGSAAVSDPDFLKEAVREFGDRIVVGIDAKNGFVAVNGWVDTTELSFIEFAKTVEQIGVQYVVFTDISKDGTLQGPNLSQLREISEAVRINIIASGGIHHIGDIKNLKEMRLYGAICGKSIYEKTLDLSEAIHTAKE